MAEDERKRALRWARRIHIRVLQVFNSCNEYGFSLEDTFQIETALA
jgi:hypothetical protein